MDDNARIRRYAGTGGARLKIYRPITGLFYRHQRGRGKLGAENLLKRMVTLKKNTLLS